MWQNNTSTTVKRLKTMKKWDAFSFVRLSCLLVKCLEERWHDNLLRVWILYRQNLWYHDVWLHHPGLPSVTILRESLGPCICHWMNPSGPRQASESIPRTAELTDPFNSTLPRSSWSLSLLSIRCWFWYTEFISQPCGVPGWWRARLSHWRSQKA